MADDTLREYFDALERLKAGRPEKVAPHTRISKDAVSLEAGRGKGTIKKSRPGFANLIAAIDLASKAQGEDTNKTARKMSKIQGEASELHEMLDAALAREMSLVNEVFELKQQLAKLTGANVYPIGKTAPKENLTR